MQISFINTSHISHRAADIQIISSLQQSSLNCNTEVNEKWKIMCPSCNLCQLFTSSTGGILWIKYMEISHNTNHMWFPKDITGTTWFIINVDMKEYYLIIKIRMKCQQWWGRHPGTVHSRSRYCWDQRWLWTQERFERKRLLLSFSFQCYLVCQWWC